MNRENSVIIDIHTNDTTERVEEGYGVKEDNEAGRRGKEDNEGEENNKENNTSNSESYNVTRVNLETRQNVPMFKPPPTMFKSVFNLQKLKVSRLTERATIPTRESEMAAGCDLYSAYDYIIPAKGKQLIKTDLQIRVPLGTYGRIAPRSGLAWNSFIDVGAGVIDFDYCGNVCVLLYNHGNEDYIIKAGNRIAQLICTYITIPSIIEVESLTSTVRNNNGFGSTGL